MPRYSVFWQALVQDNGNPGMYYHSQLGLRNFVQEVTNLDDAVTLVYIASLA